MKALKPRLFARAFGSTTLVIGVMWIVARLRGESLSGGLDRIVPLVALASPVGVVLALRGERAWRHYRAGARVPMASWAAGGAAGPILALSLVISATSSVEVAGYYPHPSRMDVFRYAADSGFTSPSLGVRVTANGEITPLLPDQQHRDASLPRYARASASIATAALALALALVAARVKMRDELEQRPRRDAFVASTVVGSVFLMGLAFRAAAVHALPAWTGPIAPTLLLAIVAVRYRLWATETLSNDLRR